MFAYEVTKDYYHSNMGIVSLHTVYVMLIVLDESTAFNIEGNLCLETIIKFIFDQNKCDFNREYAVELLNDYNITCQTKCKVTIEDIDFYSNRLWEVDIKFNDKTYAYEPCTWSYNPHAVSMVIICPTWNKVKFPVGVYCKVDEQCHGSNHSGVCQLGKCVCKDGYVLYNLECHKGNLTLNQTCSFGEQCVGSPYASCLGGICSCIEGYTAKNSTDCVQSQEITLPSSLQHHQEEAKIGTTLGALFGGILLGVILTTAAVAIIYRRSKNHVNKREELNVTFSDNDACSSAKVADPNDFQNIQTKAKKREVSPYSCLEETSIHNNVYEKLGNGQTQNDVYNHLHEQGKQDGADNYDHACAASDSAHIGDPCDYSHIRHITA
ncbi:uncharacterized protein [Magallana gigas]|uniref:uncharacterized protein isoform X1 n=2 Tax=Magallana gigas TaxID=29159 RepID=UPI003340B12F